MFIKIYGRHSGLFLDECYAHLRVLLQSHATLSQGKRSARKRATKRDLMERQKIGTGNRCLRFPIPSLPIFATAGKSKMHVRVGSSEEQWALLDLNRQLECQIECQSLCQKEC